MSFNYQIFHKEIEYLKTIWQHNSFCLFLIDSCIYKCLNKLFYKRILSKQVSKKKDFHLYGVSWKNIVTNKKTAC